jgi:hypothetical protein
MTRYLGGQSGSEAPRGCTIAPRVPELPYGSNRYELIHGNTVNVDEAAAACSREIQFHVRDHPVAGFGHVVGYVDHEALRHVGTLFTRIAFREVFISGPTHG